MSTAWYRPQALPTLVRSFRRSRASVGSAIEVWNTPCIVTRFGLTHAPYCQVLINPSSPSLLGVRKFPYFPIGGPEPDTLPDKYSHHIMGYVTQWGGMKFSEGMLFPHNTVDGLVHQLGGWPLAAEIVARSLFAGNKNDRCPVGQAVATSPGSRRLRREYQRLIHTVPPFYRHNPHPEQALASCYQNSLRQAFSKNQYQRVACPLLGAGGRGFPLPVAINIAAEQSAEWLNQETGDDRAKEKVLAFGIPKLSTAEVLVQAIDDQVGSWTAEDDAS